MSLFGLLLLILLGYFFVWPLVRVALKINAARRRYSDMMNAAGASGRAPRGEARQPGWSRRQAPRRKKIPDDTGEYVAFEDIRETVTRDTASGASGADFVREQQVEDAEWEEIR